MASLELTPYASSIGVYLQTPTPEQLAAGQSNYYLLFGWFAFLLLCALGYALNASKILFMAVRHDPDRTTLYYRLIGLFIFPMGVFMGWFVWGTRTKYYYERHEPY